MFDPDTRTDLSETMVTVTEARRRVKAADLTCLRVRLMVGQDPRIIAVSKALATHELSTLFASDVVCCEMRAGVCILGARS